MPLFNPKTLEAALRASNFIPSSTQQSAASHWAKLMRDEFLLSQKETALEADFNRYVVQDVLGYRSFAVSGTATVSVKQAVGPGEVDLALGHFSSGHTDILAPFELKGPSLKNLDAIMPGRAKTPVQQAWEYANDAVGAQWVIVSNQRELRLYAVGRGRRDYETFNLSRLDEPAVLKQFVLLLGAEYLLSGETKGLLDRSLREDKDITDKLYKDYRDARENLFQFIRDQHRGGQWRLELREQYMSTLPIPDSSRNFADLAPISTTLQMDSEDRHTRKIAFLRRLKDIAPGAESSSFLQNWPHLTFDELRENLKKRLKVEIPVSERDEWERYFNARKAEVGVLSARIADAEAEINERVYRLFDLDRDEIALIEGEIESQY